MSNTILISGRAISGKSTTADYIKYKYQDRYDVEEISFAKPLKDLCVDILKVPFQSCWGTNEDKEKPTHLKWENLPFSIGEIEQMPKIHPVYISGREILEIMGTRIFRKIHDMCWVDFALQRIFSSTASNSTRPKIFIISDVRFVNEIDHIVDIIKNATVIRLLRNPLNRPSETYLDNYDFNRPGMYVVDNTYMNIDEKNKAVSDIMESVIC